MGRLPKGIHGPIIGKVANIVGTFYNGTNYIRSMPGKYTKPLSPTQKSNTTKFRFLNNFLAPFHPFINIGLKNSAKTMTPINLAYSRNCKRMITGSSPDFEVNYAQLIWSEGDLAPLHLPELTNLQPGWIKLSWEFHFDFSSRQSDQLLLLIYCPELKITDGFIGESSRYKKQCNFQINPVMLGKALHVYVSLTSLDRKRIANNQYLGAFSIT